MEISVADIIAPTYGEIESVFIENDQLRGLRIYIGPRDNHYVFAPCSGVVTNIIPIRGQLTWYGENGKGVFKADKAERTQTGDWSVGEVHITISHDANPILVILQVGKPRYITDTIDIYVRKGETVHQKQRLGEIVLGSHSEIHWPDNAFIAEHLKTALNTRRSVRVYGGLTVVARLFY